MNIERQADRGNNTIQDKIMKDQIKDPQIGLYRVMPKPPKPIMVAA
jgi:hypothetical protein